jgi:hypothetical protein
MGIKASDLEKHVHEWALATDSGEMECRFCGVTRDSLRMKVVAEFRGDGPIIASPRDRKRDGGG